MILLEELCRGVLAGERQWLARAITLVESQRNEDKAQAEALLVRLLPHAGRSFRIGVTGVPGVGKSTFIQALSLPIVEKEKKRVAVLSIDPSSATRRGSILADKTRMPDLAKKAEAFVRPSPTNSTLGGVAACTREALLLCEAAGYEVIFVETVGVGQNETCVCDVVDVCVLLLLGGAGDELQGMKKGILEIADVFLLHKVEREPSHVTQKNIQLYQNILAVNRKKESVARSVMACSSLSGQGVAAVWEKLRQLEGTMRADRSLHSRRKAQEVLWLHRYLRCCVVDALYQGTGVDALLKKKEMELRAGRTHVRAAARDVLSFHKKSQQKDV